MKMWIVSNGPNLCYFNTPRFRPKLSEIAPKLVACDELLLAAKLLLIAKLLLAARIIELLLLSHAIKLLSRYLLCHSSIILLHGHLHG